MSRDTLKDFAFSQVSNLGFHWTPRAYVAYLEHWYHLRHLFTSFQVDVVFDVGANEGQFRNFLRRRCGYRGLIVSFEPVAAVFEVLQKKSLQDPRWQVFNCALGKSESETQFNVTEDTHFSSFLEPISDQVASGDMRNNVVRRELVKVRRLADVIKELRVEHNFKNIYAKIDTQGHDFEVLDGAAEELGNIIAIQTEVSVKPIYKGAVPFEDALHRLKQLGFEVTGLFPVQADRLFRVIEFDCVAVNSVMARKMLG